MHFAIDRSIRARTPYTATRRRTALVTKNFAAAGHVRIDGFGGVGTSAAAIAASVDDWPVQPPTPRPGELQCTGAYAGLGLDVPSIGLDQ